MKEQKTQWNMEAVGFNCFWDRLQQQWNKTIMKSLGTNNFSKQTTLASKQLTYQNHSHKILSIVLNTTVKPEMNKYVKNPTLVAN